MAKALVFLGLTIRSIYVGLDGSRRRWLVPACDFNVACDMIARNNVRAIAEYSRDNNEDIAPEVVSIELPLYHGEEVDLDGEIRTMVDMTSIVIRLLQDREPWERDERIVPREIQGTRTRNSSWVLGLADVSGLKKEPIHPMDWGSVVGTTRYTWAGVEHSMSFSPWWTADGCIGESIQCSCDFSSQEHSGHGSWQLGNNHDPEYHEFDWLHQLFYDSAQEMEFYSTS